MKVLEWVIWGFSCAWMMFSCTAFLGSVFWPQTLAQPRDARAFFSPQIKRLMSGVYVVGMAAALLVTVLWDISKLHLLWFIPLWHFFAIHCIAEVYENYTLRSKQHVSAQTLGHIMPSDALKCMLENHRITAEGLREKGYSTEEAFWICFAVISLQPFFEQEDAKILGIKNEIRLSEILQRQLAIYCEQVNKEMKPEDIVPFLNLLKEKFDEIRKIVYDDYSSPARNLSRVLYHLGGKTNIQHAVAATAYILKMSNELFDESESKSLKLIRDV